MSFVSKINVKGITAHSPEQAKVVKTLVEDLGFTHNNERFTSDHCSLVLEGRSGYEAIVDCDGKINGKNYSDFSEDYIAWLFKAVDELKGSHEKDALS